MKKKKKNAKRKRKMTEKGVTDFLTSAHGLRLLRVISVILLSRHTVVVSGSPTLGLLSAATIDLSLF